MSDPDRIKKALAAELTLVMLETCRDTEDMLDQNEAAITNMAGKIIDRLVGKGIVVTDTQAAEDETAEAHAAKKMLEILTGWMNADPTRSMLTGKALGKFELKLNKVGHTGHFYGESVQDVYAQAAQVIALQ